jgi:hypothetical protein
VSRVEATPIAPLLVGRGMAQKVEGMDLYRPPPFFFFFFSFKHNWYVALTTWNDTYPNPHISTALTLCDESWINPQSQRRNPMKDSAINSNALASKTARKIVFVRAAKRTNKKVIKTPSVFQ